MPSGPRRASPRLDQRPDQRVGACRGVPGRAGAVDDRRNPQHRAVGERDVDPVVGLDRVEHPGGVRHEPLLAARAASSASALAGGMRWRTDVPPAGVQRDELGPVGLAQAGPQSAASCARMLSIAGRQSPYLALAFSRCAVMTCAARRGSGAERQLGRLHGGQLAGTWPLRQDAVPGGGVNDPARAGRAPAPRRPSSGRCRRPGRPRRRRRHRARRRAHGSATNRDDPRSDVRHPRQLRAEVTNGQHDRIDLEDRAGRQAEPTSTAVVVQVDHSVLTVHELGPGSAAQRVIEHVARGSRRSGRAGRTRTGRPACRPVPRASGRSARRPRDRPSSCAPGR